MQQTNKTVQKKRFQVEGLDCAGCALHLQEAVAKLPGVQDAKVNFTAEKLQVVYDQATIEVEEIMEAGKRLGYKIVREAAEVAPDREQKWWKNPQYIGVFTCGLLAALAMLCSWLKATELAEGLNLAAIVIGGYPVGKNGLLRLTKGIVDADLLMLVAAIGAVAIGEWSEGAAVVFLFLLGEALEAHTMEKTRRSIRSLMTLAPSEAWLKEAAGEKKVPASEVEVGSLIIVKPGERIPLDGVVMEGISAVNQAPITGESMPVEKVNGDPLYAGTINGQGLLEMQVTKAADDSTLAVIMRRVEEAQAEKAPVEQLIDRFARYYTPLVVLLAALIAAVPPLLFQQEFTPWFYRALVLLVISCPCALVISTPVSIVAAVGNASRQGILIKNGGLLELFNKIKVLAFDKTGTLTVGHPAVTDMKTFSAASETELLALAAAVERFSEHPIAKAIIDRAAGLTLPPATEFSALPGRGAQATLADGQKIYVGSRRLFTDLGLDSGSAAEIVSEWETAGKTVLMVGTADLLYGAVAVADQVREVSRDAVLALKEQGDVKAFLLTGDHAQAAAVVASQTAVDHYYSDLLPDDKVKIVRELAGQYGKVAMIGDGINDTPALAAADIGVAMGAAGSDAALEVADIALLSDDLNKLSYLQQLSRKTMRVIRENIGFSLAVKALFLLGACLGVVNLWLAIFADTGAALLVTLNGMRLLRAIK